MSKLAYAYVVPDGSVLAIGRSLASCMSNARKVATLQGVELAPFNGQIKPYEVEGSTLRVIAGRVKLSRPAVSAAPAPKPRKRGK